MLGKNKKTMTEHYTRRILSIKKGQEYRKEK